MSYTEYDHEAYREKVDAQEKQEREELQERGEKASARLVWVTDGGREEDFEKEWPCLRDEGRRRRVVDADKIARDAQRMARTSRI